VQKHSETALDTPKNDGTKSSFPVKVHAVPWHHYPVPGKLQQSENKKAASLVGDCI
jgi:hypothetical protein